MNTAKQRAITKGRYVTEKLPPMAIAFALMAKGIEVIERDIRCGLILIAGALIALALTLWAEANHWHPSHIRIVSRAEAKALKRANSIGDEISQILKKDKEDSKAVTGNGDNIPK